MDNETKILNLLKRNAYVTTKEVEEAGISRRFLSFMVEKEIINRLSRGVYSLPNEFTDEYLIIMSKSKKVVFSNMTALYFHGLCDRVPIIYDVTVPSDYKGSLQKEIDVNLYYVKKDNFNLGLSVAKTNYGNEIRVYDVERSICDIIKNKKRHDLELFNKAIRGYYYSQLSDMNKLTDYAEKMKISNKVRKVFEVLT